LLNLQLRGEMKSEAFNSHYSPESETPAKEIPESKSLAQETKKPTRCFLNTIDSNSGEVSIQALTPDEIREIISGKKPEIFSQDDLKELVSIEQQSFASSIPEEWLEDEEDLYEEFQTLEGPQFVIREGGRLIGFLHTKPAPDAYQNFQEVGLLDQDPDFQPDPQALYIEAIAGKFGKSGLKVMKILEEQAHSLGFKKLLLHGINPRVNTLLIKRFGFKPQRQIKDWLGSKAIVLEKEILQNAKTD